ncbi:hypothetical protein EMPS_06838 [Entomortierella parvispora]|uniref:Arylamine N-acetyltransferase n=1 Tax=Entomortierella parvispora TaxID=205924 RepID=A0A9P3HDE0_9FUNG|nr:hypothetical protein EMPS_06838 [Entomortierella parvispora]
MAPAPEEQLTQEQAFGILHKIKYPLLDPEVLPEPTLDTLRELNFRCMTTFPFETLSLRATESRAVDLRLDAIYDRIVNKERGGWCFSLNKLAFSLLRSLGFRVQYTLGRVCKPMNYGDPIVYLGLTHRMSLVLLEDGSKYVFDIGFATSSFYPLRLQEHFEVEYFGHKRRIQKAFHDEDKAHVLENPPEELWQVQEYMGEGEDGQERWSPAYTFTEQQHYPVDCEIGNFWCCYSPNSPFYQSLWVIKGTADGCYNVLINRTFKVRSCKGTIENIAIKTEQQRQEILKKYFGIELTEEEWRHFDIRIE